MFSKACEYAIRAAVRIALSTARDEPATVRTIAKAIGAPETFTAKVLQQLVHAGHITSMRGPGGGFTLTPARAAKLTLADIVACIDGEEVFTGCAIGLPHCSDRRPCPLHAEFKEVRGALRAMFERSTVRAVMEKLGDQQNVFTIKA